MIKLLSKIFIKNSDQINNPKVRQGYGMLCGTVGIILNIFLFIGKYIAGVISNSVAITADSFNNLSDAGSSLITLVGFKFAGKKSDIDHPFGHGRIEYISGLAVSALIMLMGLELGKSSIEKIIHPESVEFSVISIVILVVSILVKIYMAFYNKKIGTKIDSSAMHATATDSLSDTIATSVVLLSMIVAYFTGLKIDGYCGMLVALFILYAGFNAAKETIAPLLGKAPDIELVNKINEIVLAYDEVVGIHDMVIHDYGPGRFMVSLHAEVPGNRDIFELHDAIDRIENDLYNEFDCEATIHMDPIEVDNEVVAKYREEIAKKVKDLDESVTIHDFRMVTGPTHTNLIFDIVVPHRFKMSDEEIIDWVDNMVEREFDDCFAVFKIDKYYV